MVQMPTPLESPSPVLGVDSHFVLWSPLHVAHAAHQFRRGGGCCTECVFLSHPAGPSSAFHSPLSPFPTARAPQVPKEHVLCWVSHGTALTPQNIGYLPARVPCNGHLRLKGKQGPQRRRNASFPPSLCLAPLSHLRVSCNPKRQIRFVA
jgi:hypothetical protein